MKNNHLTITSKWEPTEAFLKDMKESQKNILKNTKNFKKGFQILNKYPKRVTIFGSARNVDHNVRYKQEAYNMAQALVKEGYAVVTGGGSGIMGEANRGAYDAGGGSIGFNVRLPFEQKPNPYTTDSLTFKYFFNRKVCLSFFSQAYIYFPGGFGSMDELFEIITLIQTGKMPKLKVVLFGSEFWNPLDSFIKNQILTRGYISSGDEKLYHITDSIEETIELINRSLE